MLPVFESIAITSIIIGVLIIVIATVGGILVLKRNYIGEPRQVKIVLFGLYFWGLIFLQLIACAIAYSFLVKQ
jgi:hypothetical protein